MPPLQIQASSSIGRAPVSKTGCWRFDPVLACQILKVRSEFRRPMNIKSEEKEYRLDFAKWAVVALLVALGVYGNSHFSAQPLFYRALGLIALTAVALFVAYNTEKGAGIWALIQGSVVELRKVVWPTRQETNQTTLIVLVVVIVMSLILWALDTTLGFVASKIIG